MAQDNAAAEGERFRAQLAQLLADKFDIPEGIARRGFDLAQAAFDRAWSEATSFIKLEHDNNVAAVAMFMLGGIMEAMAQEKRPIAEFGMLLVSMKSKNGGAK